MRSLNKATLIGNITKDAELRAIPSGSSITSFSVATNRNWTTEQGEKKEETEFHRIVVWNKLAEIVAKYGTKGKKVYIEGRLATREWNDKEGQKRSSTEIIATDVIFLDKNESNEQPKGGEDNHGQHTTNDTREISRLAQ